MSQSKETLTTELTQLAIQIRQSEQEIGRMSRELSALDSQADVIRAEIAGGKTKLAREQALLDATVAQLAKVLETKGA